MQKKNFLMAAILIFIVLSIAWVGSLNWGGPLAQKRNQSEAFFVEFDKKSDLEGENCFSVQIKSNRAVKTIVPYYTIVNEKVIANREVDLSQNPTIKECFSTEILSLGDNLVEVHVGDNKLFYHTLLSEEAIEEKVPLLSVSFDEDKKLLIKVEGDDNSKYTPIEIFVNDAFSHRVYFSGESFESRENVALKEGENKIIVEFKGVSATANMQKGKEFEMHPIVGVAIISALLCVMAFLVFVKQPFLEKIAYSIMSFFTVLIIAFFLLELIGVLSAFNFVLFVAIITIVLAIGFRENLKEKAIEKIHPIKKLKENPLLLLLIVLLVFSSFFFNMFTDSYYSDWTSFYERQSRTITGNQTLPIVDEFSFLGTKPFGYMSAYFFINPGVSWLTGLGTQQSFAIIIVLAQIAFIASALLFFRSFGFKEKRSYLALIVLLMSGFVFADFSFNIRHVISYALLFLSLFFLRKEKPLHSGSALALGIFVQTPIILMFLAALPIVLTRKKTIKTAVKSIAIGAVIALILFAPTLIRTGIPTQAEYNVWGYFWSIPLYGFFLDYLAVVLLIALFIVPFLFTKDTKFDKFSIRVGVFLALFIFIQLFVSYRINVIATLAFALFVGLLFPKRMLENKISEYSLAVLFAITFALMFLLTISFYPVVPSEQNAFKFVKENTSTEANFLNEPYLGHAFILLTERKSSADLAVEYANEEMIRDSFEFIKTGNSEILEKYDIDYVVNRSIFLDEKPVGDNLWHELLEYEELNKIYANGLFFVHWADKEN